MDGSICTDSADMITILVLGPFIAIGIGISSLFSLFSRRRKPNLWGQEHDERSVKSKVEKAIDGHES